jgi:hypothetical protein
LFKRKTKIKNQKEQAEYDELRKVVDASEPTDLHSQVSLVGQLGRKRARREDQEDFLAQYDIPE